MSNHAQTLCDIDASDAEAEGLKQRLLEWLIAKRIIQPEITDCVLSPEGGYPQGENYGFAICGQDVEPTNPPRPGINGLEVKAGRMGYWGGDLEAVVCPHCRHRESMTPREEGRWDTDFGDAINDWVAGGAGLVTCLECGSRNGLNDWEWSHPWAFGALGMTMWDWDGLSPTFIAEVSKVLDGHRLVYSAFKL